MEFTPQHEQSKFDELGRRAGAAMRPPAPEAGFATIARRARRRSTATVVGSLVAVAIAFVITGSLRRGTDDTGPATALTTTVPVAVPTTIAGFVQLSGVGSRSAESFRVAPGEYVVTFAPDPYQCDGWVFHVTGEGGDDPFRKLGGGSSPNGASVRTHLEGGLYTFTIETTCEWSFTVTPT